MSTDTSFFTNEPGFSLKERFRRLVQNYWCIKYLCESAI